MLKQSIQQWKQEYVKEGREQGIVQGLEQGLEQGREQGHEQGRRTMLRELITIRFGTPTPETIQTLESATSEKITQWTTGLFEAASVKDLLQH